jgi:hypothetical protein
MSTTSAIPSQEEMEQLSARGHAIYDNTLKAILEPQYNGQEVAIHLDTGDYEVAKNSPHARRALRARRPEGLIMTTNIGPAKMDGLTLRMLGSQLLSGENK